MNKKVKIEIIVPSDARYMFDSPYMKHGAFIKYCNANNVYVSKAALEIYEKNRLLFPCVRLMYPRELLIRRYRSRKSTCSKAPKIIDKWLPLEKLEESVKNCRLADKDEFHDMVKNGHPYDRALKDKTLFILNPEDNKFKSWGKYNILVDKHDKRNIYESKAKHYYAPWKIFMVQELNIKNTDEHNRAPGTIRRCGLLDEKLLPSVLGEFTPFFNTITSFRCRFNMLLIAGSLECAGKKRIKRSVAQRRAKSFSKKLFGSQCYKDWIRFLRKLIELHESYLKDEKYLLSLGVRPYMASTIAFLGYSKGHKYKFKKICEDVSGERDKCLGSGFEQGVKIYPGRLEEIFADEEYDLDKNVKDIIRDNVEQFNNLLGKEEKLGGSFADELFDELKEGPGKVILATIGKTDRVYNDNDILWPDNELWSCLRDLAVCIDDIGNVWFGGGNIDGIFTKAFRKEYQTLKGKTNDRISGADKGTDYIKKLQLLQKNKELADDKKCGKHLLVTRLTRNFSAHKAGLSGNDLHDNLALIYNALVSTLFVLYDSHTMKKEKKINL